MYTDFGLLTCNEEIASDVNDIFIQLTGLGRAGSLKRLFQSPFTLHSMIMEAIQRETEHAQAGKPAQIIAKMNSLLEPQVIHALYRASQAGVKIQLIVRGVCALRPGVPGCRTISPSAPSSAASSNTRACSTSTTITRKTC